MKNDAPELLPADNAVALRPDQAMDVSRPQPTVGEMLRILVTQGITNENVAALEKMTDLYERMEAREADKAFAAAFNALQAEMPTIVASSVIPNRGKYERFEDVMRQIAPVLHKHGFSVAFSQDFKENRIIETCHLTHIGGVTKSSSFAVRVGGKADSDTQADIKAATTAKRRALQDALNIVIRQDCLNDENDASLEGGNITEEQAEELERRVKMTNSDVVKFLAYAGANTFKEIPSGKYSVLDELLAKREGNRR